MSKAIFVYIPTERFRGLTEVDIIDNKFNFVGLTMILPDFWHNLIAYKEIFKIERAQIIFRLSDMQCSLLICGGEYVCDLSEENYEKVINIVCRFNFQIIDSELNLVGYSNEIFQINNIKYKKLKFINIYVNDDDFITYIYKLNAKYPDYNFTKFSENDDIKIALKD